jgi:tRNA(adenine34) deaminase
MTQADLRHLRSAIAVARRGREHGNRPFGALPVAADGRVLAEAENTELTTGDSTGHAELNLIREHCAGYTRDELAGATLYASGQPCAMCAGAVLWSGVGRLVFGLGSAESYAMADDAPDHRRLSCREVLTSGRRPVAVEGPAREVEARRVFDGFFAWSGHPLEGSRVADPVFLDRDPPRDVRARRHLHSGAQDQPPRPQRAQRTAPRSAARRRAMHGEGSGALHVASASARYKGRSRDPNWGGVHPDEPAVGRAKLPPPRSRLSTGSCGSSAGKREGRTRSHGKPARRWAGRRARRLETPA